MTAVVNTAPGLASRLVNGVLAIKPLANLAKQQARQMMIKRAQKIGVPWTKEVQALSKRDWESHLAKVQNPQLTYPEYYLRSFHAYEKGNLSWEAAWEVEVAARAVHAGIWPDAGAQGDARLRQSYHDILKAQIFPQPHDILDMGCSVGMSTFAMQATYPEAQVTGLDLSPYFLAVADYKSALLTTGTNRGFLVDGVKGALGDGESSNNLFSSTPHLPFAPSNKSSDDDRAQYSKSSNPINWVHAAAESTGLADASFDLVSIFLMCHELPQSATKQILCEARRLLRPGGHLTIMDMNPKSGAYAKMPPYIFTLLKSTEPYLDEYFALDIEQAIVEAGFSAPTIAANSPRHRTVIARVMSSAVK